MIFQVKKMNYNPGFLTTGLVLNPFCVVTIFYAWKFNILTSMDWVLAFIVGGAYILILMLTRPDYTGRKVLRKVSNQK
jgi:hypothetical protein